MSIKEASSPNDVLAAVALCKRVERVVVCASIFVEDEISAPYHF